MTVPLLTLQMFCLVDLSVPLRYCSYCSARALVGPMELVARGAFEVPKMQGLLCESICPPFPRHFPTLFAKQRVGLVAEWEDWARQGIR